MPKTTKPKEPWMAHAKKEWSGRPIKPKKKVKPNAVLDAWLMLQVFNGCIESRTAPDINSKCHKKLVEIICAIEPRGRRKGR